MPLPLGWIIGANQRTGVARASQPQVGFWEANRHCNACCRAEHHRRGLNRDLRRFGEGNPPSEQEKDGGPAPPHQGTLITAKRESDFFVLGWGSLVVLGGRRMRTGRGCVMRCVGWLIGSRAGGMKSRSRRRRFPAPMHERLLRCFENNVDLVFSH